MDDNDLTSRIHKDFEDLIEFLEKTCDEDERDDIVLAKMAFKAFKFFRMGYRFTVTKQ